MRTPKQIEALKLISEGRFYPVLEKEEDGWHARWRASCFLDESNSSVDGWVDEYVREAAMTRLTEDAEEQRHETLHDAWMTALASRTGLVVWDDDECDRFAKELEDWSGAAAPDVAARGSLTFVFTAAGPNEQFQIRCVAPKGRRALKALGQAAYVWGPLRALRATDEADGTILSTPLTRTETESLVHTGAAAIRDAGYRVEGVPVRAVVTASAEVDEGEKATSKAVKTRLTVRVAGEPVTAAEVRFLLEQGTSIVYFRDRWIEVDRNILREALRALERGLGKKPNLLSFALGIGHIGGLEIESLKAHGWLRGLVNELKASRRPLSAPTVRPAAFCGELRPYQAEGVAWMRFLTDHGFGALLADDMGLGKTVQTIVWMAGMATAEPFLVVAPLTLLANWKHEMARFVPTWRVYIHQGDGRHLASGFGRAARASQVVLTSYNLLVKDYSMFSEVTWAGLVLDEAQAIKNPDTQAARAVKALTPMRRVALTGTPIENSLLDVWSLEDFLNPGFLGDRKSFATRFVRPVAIDANAAVGRRLRRALEPFVLRRLKTDPAIAAEIGAKREVCEYCTLDAASRRAYEEALAAYRVTEHTPGDAFALLTELKLICDGGGKFERLSDLLETIFANGESALVFTQYAKVGARLQADLARRFGRRFPFLHGTLSASAREEEIRRFNAGGAKAFILSLKAGGNGLNLTKATHVIHYDRWWNPAVENQATDRAHRIGQSRDVWVHLLVTEGTVEEHVDELLRRKRTLGEVLADGAEFWKAVALT